MGETRKKFDADFLAGAMKFQPIIAVVVAALMAAGCGSSAPS